jgi:hypothetical protein
MWSGRPAFTRASYPRRKARTVADWRLAMDSAQPLQPWIDPGAMAVSNLARLTWLEGDPAHAD